MCKKLLAVRIRNDPAVKGIPVYKSGKTKAKISLYGDDATLLLPGTEEALQNVLAIFQKFQIYSGLKLNISECEVLKIGSLKNSVVFCKDSNRKMGKPIRISFSYLQINTHCNIFLFLSINLES